MSDKEWEKLLKEVDQVAVRIGVAKAQREELVKTLEEDFGIEYNPDKIEDQVDSMNSDIDIMVKKKNKFIAKLRTMLDDIQDSLDKMEGIT